MNLLLEGIYIFFLYFRVYSLYQMILPIQMGSNVIIWVYLDYLCPP